MESTGFGRRVRFGQFEVDEKTGELRKDGTKIRLQEQPLQILRILLEHPGELVAREELRKRVWPSDTFVDFDHGINYALVALSVLIRNEWAGLKIRCASHQGFSSPGAQS